MKLNSDLLEKLKEKNIQLDVAKFSEKLAQSYVLSQSQYGQQAQNQRSSNDRLSSATTRASATPSSMNASSTNFRVRPLTSSQRNDQSTQLERSSIFATPSIIHKDLSHSTFINPLDQIPQIISSSTSSATSNPQSKLSGAASQLLNANPSKVLLAPQRNNNNTSNTINSIADMKASVSGIYKDVEQNRLRQGLLDYEDVEHLSEEEEEEQDEENEDQRTDEEKEEFNEDPLQSVDPFERYLKKQQYKQSQNPTESETDDLETNEEAQLRQNIEDHFTSETLTIAVVEAITKVKEEDFPLIRRTTFRHDCTKDSLQLFGELLPNLQELNLNDSIVNCLRDLGTSLRNLRVLFLSRVKLNDLAGINAFPQLSELYASYNTITSLNEIYFNDTIEILDLEGNEIADMEAIEVLETLPKLKQLSLGLNPIAKTMSTSYRSSLATRLIHLELLDETPIGSTLSQSGPIGPGFGLPDIQNDEDIYESLKKLNWGSDKFLSNDIIEQLDVELKNELPEEDLFIYSVKRTTNKAKNQQLTNNSNVYSQSNNQFSNLSRPQSSNPFSTTNQTLKKDQEVKSVLVMGTDEAFCGNPLKALKHKRKNELEIKVSDSSAAIPKNIVNLLDQFNHETDLEELTRLKEDLKKYDAQLEKNLSQTSKVLRIRRPIAAARLGLGNTLNSIGSNKPTLSRESSDPPKESVLPYEPTTSSEQEQQQPKAMFTSRSTIKIKGPTLKQLIQPPLPKQSFAPKYDSENQNQPPTAIKDLKMQTLRTSLRPPIPSSGAKNLSTPHTQL